jgi:hypothetical protein
MQFFPLSYPWASLSDGLCLFYTIHCLHSACFMIGYSVLMFYWFCYSHFWISDPGNVFQVFWSRKSELWLHSKVYWEKNSIELSVKKAPPKKKICTVKNSHGDFWFCHFLQCTIFKSLIFRLITVHWIKISFCTKNTLLISFPGF